MPEVLDKPRARKAAPVKPTLGATIDKMWKLREEKRGLDTQVKTIEAEIKSLEADMFELLDAQDTRKAEGKNASVSIGESVVGTVDDWEATWAYIAKNKFFHLVQKRPNARSAYGASKYEEI